jgi:hypothetical protein
MQYFILAFFENEDELRDRSGLREEKDIIIYNNTQQHSHQVTDSNINKTSFFNQCIEIQKQ